MSDELMQAITIESDSRASTSGATPPIGERLVAAGLTLRRAQYNLISLAAAFETSNEWARAGSRTAAHWIGERLDVTVTTAREWIRVGRALEGLPGLDEALATNALSYSKVRTLTRMATPENEQELIALATKVTAGQLNGALAAWSERNEDEAVRVRRLHEQRSFKSAVQPDGSGLITIRLPPAEFAATVAVIDAIVMGGVVKPESGPRLVGAPAEAAAMVDDAVPQEAQLGQPETSAEAKKAPPSPPANASAEAPELKLMRPERWPSLAQQRADAFVWLLDNGGGGVTTEVVVHLRGDGNAFDDGTPLSNSIVERLLPDAFVRLLLHDAESSPINASHRRRYPTTRQKRVVRERDRACLDCGSTELLEFDHVPEFELTGHTVVEELELRCGPCHRARHKRAA